MLFKQINYFFATITLIILFLFGIDNTALADTIASSESCKIGTFVTSIHSLNVKDKSFAIDFWVWSNCASEINPLKTMEVTNAIKFAAEQDSTEKKGNIYWSQRKYRATIYQNWKTENFPFDRQHLYVELEDGAADISKRVYIPDVKNSSLSQNIILDGFKIKDFQIQELKFNYPTSFGDPEINHAGSTFSRLRIRMTIVRQEFFGFFKLNMGTYIAFAITLLSFLMHPKQTSIFSARMSLLVGSLFAVVISMRASDSIIGTSQGLSLIDQIHITTMVYIFSSAAIAIFSLRCCETGHDKLALRIDARCLWIFAASFVAMNGVLISTAIFRG